MPGESLSSLKSSSSTDTGAIDKCSPKELAITLVVCTVYMVVGPLLIMLNKYLLTTGRFHYPILLTTMHQVSSSFCCAVLIKGMACVPLQHEVTWKVWRTNIFAVGLTTTAALCTGNASYLYLTVAFVEILKGFTPVVTMMVQSLFGEPLPSCRIASCVLLISLGTAISSFGELHMNLTGLLLMLGSVYCEATRLMLTQKLLLHMNFHVLEGLYYMSPASALCAFAVALVVEVPRFKMGPFLATLPQTWHLFLMNAFLGFLVNGAYRLARTHATHASRRSQANHAHTQACSRFFCLRLLNSRLLPRDQANKRRHAETPRHQPQRLSRACGHPPLRRPRLSYTVLRLRDQPVLLLDLQLPARHE